MYNSIKDKIISRIYGHGMGWVFSPNDFLQDFKRYEIDNAEMWQKIKQRHHFGCRVDLCFNQQTDRDGV